MAALHSSSVSRAGHRYELGDFGLSPAEVDEAFAGYLGDR
jgi:hypothetical protein